MIDLPFNERISFDYQKPSEKDIEEIKAKSGVCIIEPSKNIVPVNSYYQDQRKGSAPQIYTREIISEKINWVAQQLLPHYGLFIFDAFRTIETQADLFDFISDEVRKNYPSLNDEQVEIEARKFAAHPYDRSHFKIPPHNSGGAIDLAIYDLRTQKMCNFGTAFDEVSESSNTNFFEKDFSAKYGYTEEEWNLIRNNRRVLFNLMKQARFTNFENEWWHYDLGDCLWAEILAIDYIFESLEDELKTAECI